MKQHISKQQWDELSDEQKRLISDRYVNCLMNIGQMIEFLGEDFSMLELTLMDLWEVTLCMESNDHIETFENEELCDALWQACVYKLKNYE